MYGINSGKRLSVKRIVGACLIAWLLPLVAMAADPATEAALEANTVNQAECANLYSSKIDTAASSTVRVAEAWQRVSTVYEETEAPYLLYWRGALAQCLGRNDSAIADLSEFVESQKGLAMFTSLVENAQQRLRRLTGRRNAGNGLAASWLRQSAPLEFVARWGFGAGLSLLACTDNGTRETGSPVNSSCIGGVNPRLVARPTVSWSTVDLGVDGFFTRGFGIGVRGIVDLTQSAAGPGPSDELLSKPLLPVAELQVGPQVRVLTDVASGSRAGWFRASLRFAAAFGRLAPWAGQVTELDNLGAFHDAGTYALVHVGPALVVSGAVEAGANVVFDIEGRVSWYVPMPGATLPKVREGEPVDVQVNGTDETREEFIPVELQSAPLRGGRLHAGARLGLWAPAKGAQVALGPFLDVGFQQTFLAFPDEEGDVWCSAGYDIDGSSQCSGTADLRKVYSTQRSDLRLTLGIQARFGVIGKPGADE